VLVTVVPPIRTYGRELFCSRVAVMRLRGMLVQFVVRMPVPERQCGCTERRYQAGEECDEGASGASEHLVQN
jgi:hypothetical protein